MIIIIPFTCMFKNIVIPLSQKTKPKQYEATRFQHDL